MYHYVRPYNSKLPNLKHLDIEDFKLQLDFFESRFGFVSKEDFYMSLNSGLPAKGVILTFDDGFSCHYDFVFKELLKRKLWGIFYIPTGVFTQKKMLDVHRIHILLAKIPSDTLYKSLIKHINEDMLPGGLVREYREDTYQHQKNDDFTNITKRILNYYIDYAYRENILDILTDEFIEVEHRDPIDFYMTVEQIKELNDKGMLIGSHTVKHPLLSKLTRNEQIQEIKDSFEFLNNVCGGLQHKTFCYPYGGFHSFTSETEMILENENCEFAFNVEHRDVSKLDLSSRRQALPRYDCNHFPFGKCRIQ